MTTMCWPGGGGAAFFTCPASLFNSPAWPCGRWQVHPLLLWTRPSKGLHGTEADGEGRLVWYSPERTIFHSAILCSRNRSFLEPLTSPSRECHSAVIVLGDLKIQGSGFVNRTDCSSLCSGPFGPFQMAGECLHFYILRLSGPNVQTEVCCFHIKHFTITQIK